MPILAFIVFIASLAACAAEPVRDLVFEVPGGMPVELYRRPGAEAGRQTRLDLGAAVTFAPAGPVEAPREARAVRIRLEGPTGGLLLEILGDADAVSKALPVPDDGGRRVELVVGLPAGRFAGFRLSRARDAVGQAARLVGAGFARPWTGLSLEEDLLTLAGQLGYRTGADGEYSLAWQPDGKPGALAISYRADRLAAGAALQVASSTGASRAFRVLPHAGETTVFLYDAGLGFSADRLELRGFGQALRGVRILPPDSGGRADPAGRGGPEPLTIDLGVLLAYPGGAWRGRDFELFRWNLFPEILIFDTIDLAYQERMFSRLAFFLEKKQYRGRLLTNRELEGKHGWNAHNYDPVGLASFFNKAREQSFRLNPEELVLLDVLLVRNVVLNEGGRFQPGRGGILAVSRESGDAHRRLLLTHEAWHGVYYGNAGLRDQARQLWAALEPEERRFWIFFFGWMNYDITNQALLVNEYQAYLLQQDVRLIDHYFKTRVLERIGENYPEYRSQFEQLFDERPDMLVKPARILDDFVRKQLGFGAGQLFCLVPEKP